jgi:hypothetical protein
MEAILFSPALVRRETGDCAGEAGFDERFRDRDLGLVRRVANLRRLAEAEKVEGGGTSLEALTGPTETGGFDRERAMPITGSLKNVT